MFLLARKHDIWRTIALFLAALPVLVLWKKDLLWVILGGAGLSLIFFS